MYADVCYVMCILMCAAVCYVICIFMYAAVCYVMCILIWNMYLWKVGLKDYPSELGLEDTGDQYSGYSIPSSIYVENIGLTNKSNIRNTLCTLSWECQPRKISGLKTMLSRRKNKVK